MKDPCDPQLHAVKYGVYHRLRVAAEGGELQRWLKIKVTHISVKINNKGDMAQVNRQKSTNNF